MSEQTKFYRTGAVFLIVTANFLKEIWLKPKKREPIKAVEYEELPTQHRRIVDNLCQDKEILAWLLGYMMNVIPERELEKHFL